MLVTFTETRHVSEDGFSVRQCHKDQTYDLADGTARYAIRQGWAHAATDQEEAIYIQGIEPPQSASEAFFDILALQVRAQDDFNRLFRPQPARPTNPATLIAKGEEL